MNLWDLPRTERDAVSFLQTKGIIQTNLECKQNHPMLLYFGSEIFWKCNECNEKKRVRIGNWFKGSRIPFVTAIRFIYGWAHEQTSIMWCERELKMNESTVVHWNRKMREVCMNSNNNKAKRKIGGEKCIVEIDESLFTKRKNNSGRILPPQWVFGGLCREKNEAFMLEIPDRSSKTLFGAISENIESGSIIHSDSWRGYKTKDLEKAGYENCKVNHKHNFVDPISGAHTQTVERMWGSAKMRNKRQRGTARHHLTSYLIEFIWRKELGTADPFDAILTGISEYRPL